MQVLAEAVFTGRWRSFKLFKRSGDIRLHSTRHYREFIFDNKRELTITSYDGDQIEAVVQTNQWTIAFKEKRHYLTVANPRIVYEIITVNHTVMVLADPVSSEKIFFSKNEFWQGHLKTNHSMLL